MKNHKRFLELAVICISLNVFALTPWLWGATSQEWLFSRGDLQNQGTSPSQLKVPLILKWKFRAIDASRSSTAGPVTDGNMVFFTSGPEIYGLDVQTGEILWLDGSGAEKPYNVSRPALVSPALADGLLYVGTTAGDVLQISSPNGNLVGRTAGLNGGVSTAPLVYNERVYVGTRGGRLYVIDATSMNVISELKISGEINGLALLEPNAARKAAGLLAPRSRPYRNGDQRDPTPTGKVLLCVTTANQRFITVTDDGRNNSRALRILRVSTVGTGGTPTEPALFEGSAFIGIGKRVVSMDLRTGHRGVSRSIGADILSSPAIAKGMIFAGGRRSSVTYTANQRDDRRGIIFAGDARTRRPRWSRIVPSAIHSPPLVVDGMVLQASYDGVIYALDIEDGKILWRYRLVDSEPEEQEKGLHVVAPMAVVDNTLFVVSNDGVLFCFSTNFVDVREPSLSDAILRTKGATKQTLKDNMFNEEYGTILSKDIPTIKGQPPVTAVILITDDGSGIDESSIRVTLDDTTPLNWKFKPVKGELWVDVLAATGNGDGATPMRDAQYEVVVQCRDYAGNAAKGRFRFNVDTRLRLPSASDSDPNRRNYTGR